ncbi:Membrane protein insertase YidC [Planctomycetes bacterium Pan216]|uniref:Membrane protein insertase YidC n=1 Tax=Kolteria novifilia TaxID=2527975 RepID=A0A518BCP4_9BACT|nr:Membrane protein insertase YidC [Planctomycetes bacterium Pan216]
MDKRYLWFWVVMVVIWLGWSQLMMFMYPNRGKKPDLAAKNKIEAKADAPAKGEEAKTPAKEKASKDAKPEEGAEKKEPAAAVVEQAAVPLRKDLVLGKPTDDPGRDAPDWLYARLSNQGAAVTFLQLNRYKNEERDGPMILLTEEDPGNVPSFVLDLVNNDGNSLAERNWEVVESSPEKVVFRTQATPGKLQIEKRYSIEPGSPMIRLEIALKNVSEEPLEDVSYTLTSGNGLPVEGSWYTNYFRRMVVLMVEEGGGTRFSEKTSKEVAGGDETPFETTPIQFSGIVDQYFASLIIQKPDPQEERIIGSVRPDLLYLTKETQFSNIAAEMTSKPVWLKPDSEVVHEFLLYNGPKDPEILDEFADFHLPEIIHYPNFVVLPIGTIAKTMVWIVNFFYSLVGDYGLAIIMLTIVVRGCLFPLSFKATASMTKMAALKPKIDELREKYGTDKEKMHRELMDLYAKNKVNPFGGCLILFLQFPIFIGLWQALYNSFALRNSTFLYGWTWIDNLAAPDQLFPFGFNMPFLGPYFNLLPILAVVQMVIQQKMMTPPATTPEAELQQKMMKWMMVVIGFLFYKVPAGLCIYIMASGTWSLCERKLLPRPQVAPTADPRTSESAVKRDESTWKTAAKPKKKAKSKR